MSAARSGSGAPGSGPFSSGAFGSGSTRERGSRAERDGARWLERRGYRIVARNVRFRFGEIDVVAREGETLCFIEIKARRTERFGAPGEAVTRRKQHRLVHSARAYLSRNPHDGPCRFDVLAMRADSGGWRFELFRDAFRAC